MEDKIQATKISKLEIKEVNDNLVRFGKVDPKLAVGEYKKLSKIHCEIFKRFKNWSYKETLKQHWETYGMLFIVCL